MIRKFMPLVLISGLLLVPIGAAGAQDAADAGVVVEAARQVTTSADPVRLFVIPEIAVSPGDPSTVVVAAGDARNGGCGLHVSQDAGMSWRTTAATVMPADLPFCVQRNFGPVVGLAFAADGTLYFAASGSSPETDPPHPNGPITGLLARTSNLGEAHDTFVAAESRVVDVDVDGDSVEAFQQWRIPSVAVDPNDPDTVYMGWRLWMGTDADVPFSALPQRSYVAVSRDGGETWSDPVDIIAEGMSAETQDELGIVTSGAGQTHSDTPAMVVASDGTVYAFTKERPTAEDDPPSRLFMAVSSNQGQTWETRVFNDGANNIDTPDVAIDADDNLYVTYASRGEERTDPSQVFFQASTDRGETWTDPRNLSDAGEASGYNKYFPGISVAPNGRIDIAWHDYQNDPFFQPGGGGPMGQNDAERYSDIYYSFSSDGGQTWSPNARITDRSMDRDIGVTFNNQAIRGPIGVASTDTSAYFVWPDSRNGTPEFEVEDAYFTRVRFPAAAATTAAAATDNSITWGLLGAAIALGLGGLVLMAGTRMARKPRGAAAPASRP